MVTPVRIAVAAMCLGLAACSNNGGSSVGSPDPATSAVLAPRNAMTMTCGEFTKLDQPVRLEVVRTILAAETGAPGQLTPEMAEGMTNAMCGVMPDQTVRVVLTGPPPP